MTVKVVKFIYADNELAGDGSTENPYRKLQQLYTLDGGLVCQYDPHLHINNIPDRGNGGSLFAMAPSFVLEGEK